MRLFIPPLGSRLRLLAPWQFTLFEEYRNTTLRERIGVDSIEYDEIHTGQPGTMAGYAKTPGELILFNAKQPTFNQLGLDMQARFHVVGVQEELGHYKATGNDTHRRELVAFDLVLPTDTVLVLDRIYIRKGKDDFDSITFQVESSPLLGLKSTGRKGFLTGKVRFWVKLEEANRIECELA